MALDRPLVLFENILDDSSGTLTVTAEAAGWPKENMLDWRMGTAYRWKGDTTNKTDIKMDLGAGNEQTADAVAFAGHNFATMETGQIGRVEVAWSTDDVTYSNVLLETFDDANTPFPYVGKWPQPAAKRYWRIRYNKSGAPTPFDNPPELGIVTLGRALSLEGFTSGFEPYSRAVEVDVLDSQVGDFLGANIRSRVWTFDLDYPAGFAVSDFWDPSSGIGFDDFATHLKQDKPFWLFLDRGNIPTNVLSRNVWLCRSRDWRSPMVGTSARRALSATINAYQEIA